MLSRLRDLAVAEPLLLAGKLRVLVDLDAASHLPYVATLRAYLDTFGDIPAAAAAMNVHPNTYRYRLRRLTELAALHLDDPLERLAIHLQLHILPAQGPAAGTGSAPLAADGLR
jgi:DNA-binding PucR family transcriptional regulator